MINESICPIHDIQMEWVVDDDEYIFPEGGYWFCQTCWEVEEYYEHVYGNDDE